MGTTKRSSLPLACCLLGALSLVVTTPAGAETSLTTLDFNMTSAAVGLGGSVSANGAHSYIQGDPGDGGGNGYEIRRQQRPAGEFGPRFRLALTAAVGYSAASGEWFDGFNHGPFAVGAIRAPVSNFVYLGGEFRYQMLGAEESIETLTYEDEFGSLFDVPAAWDVTLTEYLFLIGFMSNPVKNTTPIVYFELGFGAIYHDIELTLTIDGDTEVTPLDETQFAFQTGFGAMFPVARGLGFDFEGTVRFTGDWEGSAEYEPSNGYLWGVSLGLVFLFGE